MKVRLPSQRFILFGIVITSILLSASGSYLTFAQGRKQDRLVACTIKYNELAGLARDERAGFAKSQTKADKKVWKKLYKQFSAPPVGTEEQQRDRFLRAIENEIEALDAVLNAQAENKYPDPNACKDGKITAEEGNVS